MKNKKGVVPLIAGLTLPIAIVLALLILLVGGGLLIFASINKFVIIGGGMIALALIFGLRGDVNKTKAYLLGIIIISGLVFIFASGTMQSIFSIDRIETSVEGGKVYWTVFASASDMDERYDFVKKMGKYTYPDGKIVTPKQSMAILIQEQDSSCRYSVIDLGDGIKGLSNPSIDIELFVLDGHSAQSQILKGEKADSVTFTDPDGEGKLVVSSTGILGRESRCPDYENVALVKEDNLWKVVYKSEVLQRREDCRIIGGNMAYCIVGFFKDYKDNTQFTSAFTSYYVSGTEVRGRGLNLGEATFTITADEDYFESVIYTPPKDCEPEITDIAIAKEIKEGSSSSVRVNIENKKDADCKVTISMSSLDDISFSPKSREVTLRDDATTTFTISNGDDIGDKSIEAEACFISQFEGETCDIKSTSFESIKKSIITPSPKEECGDGTCQDFESYTTCPDDCEQPTGCEEDSDCEEGEECVEGECKEKDLECVWYQEEKTETEVIKSWYNYIGIGEPTIVSEKVCATAGWVYGGIIGVVAVILGSLAILTRGKPKKRK